MALPFDPPLPPTRARSVATLPQGRGWLYEPQWDGFRALVFRDGDRVQLQSRDLRPLERYFPDLLEPVRRCLPPAAVVDGEIVIAGERGLDFAALLQRIHPAPARVAALAAGAPASLVLWDLLALGDEDLRHLPLWQRRRRLEQVLARVAPPVFLTPATRERRQAEDWCARLGGAGLDGVVAKRLEDAWEPGERSLTKVKQRRAAACVVGGFRWQRDGAGTLVGSLLLGLHDPQGRLRHVGIAGGFTPARRRRLARELAPLRAQAGHPFHDVPVDSADSPRPPAAPPGDHAWEPLRPERVCEVGYHHLQGPRFRHATHFLRWRPDLRPSDCRLDQLDERPACDLAELLAPPLALHRLAPGTRPLAGALGIDVGGGHG